MNIKNLQVNNECLHDLYLKRLLTGEVQGPLTQMLSQDKPWLIYYTDDQIIKYYQDMENGVCDCSIFDYMMRENKDHLDDVALYYFGKQITYRKLEENVNKFAASVLEKGIKPGDKVTLCMPNTPEAVYAFYGLNKIGAVANMIHPLSAANEIRDFLNEVHSRMLITIDTSFDKVDSIVSDTEVEDTIIVSPADSMPLPLKVGYHLTVGGPKIPDNKGYTTFSNFLKLGKGKKVESYKYEGNEITVMLHTGGTTGKSKAATFTNMNFNSMVEQFKYNVNNFSRGDKMLTVMPVFHGFGLCSSLHLPLSYGVGCILIPKLEAKEIGNIFKKYHPNHILGVPTLFKGIIKCKDLDTADLSYVKNIVSGGDLVKNSLEDCINRFFAERGANVMLEKGYGLTEVVAGATFAVGEYNHYGSNGIPMIGTNLKLVKPNTDEEVHIGEMGEICLQGPTVMQGYYNKEKENNKTLQDSWLHTGDVGHVVNSELFFDSRRGDMIISSGNNVYPNVIEQVIEDHYAVSNCAVIGIPDSYKGEVAKAFVVLKEGEYDLDSVQAEILELCEKNLNKYFVPKEIEYVDELPQTLLGKVTRQGLRKQEESPQLVKSRIDGKGRK